MSTYREEQISNRDPESGSDEPIILDVSQKANVTRIIREAISTLKTLQQMAVAGSATAGLRYNTLSIVRSNTRRVAELLGANPEEQDASEAERIQRSLRAANLEIRRLEAAIGKGITNEAVGHGMSRIASGIMAWWKDLIVGGHVSKLVCEAGIGYATIRAELSGMIQFGGDDDNPVSGRKSAAERFAVLEQQISVTREDKWRAAIHDTEGNREWIKARLTERFPGANIFTITSYVGRCVDQDTPTIRDIQVSIPFDSLVDP